MAGGGNGASHFQCGSVMTRLAGLHQHHASPCHGAENAYTFHMRESDLLRHIYGANASLPDFVTIPPGDDMGALDVPGQVLTTVDQVADGVHVHLATTPLEKVGRKAITRNLSDVAAMGAVPRGAVVAACLPLGFSQDRATALFDAMRRTAASYGCPLFGGDIAMWDHPLVLTVTVLASTGGIEPLLRRGARIGDVICVTGELGGSLETVDGYTHHLDFEPRLKVAGALAKSDDTRPHCMIDLSDGLSVDLGHLCRAANAAALVEAERLPLSLAARIASKRDHRPAWQHAMGDGEDYELCFTLSPQQAERLLSRRGEDVPITPIGEILPAQSAEGLVRVRLADGSTQSVSDLGWEHHG